mmetsp:Transcript_32789/g.101583  ORF Transcript_32789/g.101583 Transcript_32789/m.101583 type:complete len:220 (-) Transcript_32789:723-1382(-)
MRTLHPRPTPPILPVSELCLLEPPWRKMPQATGASDYKLRALLTRACQSPLVPSEQRHALSVLASDSNTVVQCGLTPNMLPDLVENNAAIAIKCLSKLSSRLLPDYLSALVTMDMSLHSMEVVNHITNDDVMELPAEFIHMYISKCISSCDKVEDKYYQNRIVRLVCVFLQSLIRNKIVNVHELYVEVQPFCIANSRIREATGLFRLLKSRDELAPHLS